MSTLKAVSRTAHGMGKLQILQVGVVDQLAVALNVKVNQDITKLLPQPDKSPGPERQWSRIALNLESYGLHPHISWNWVRKTGQKTICPPRVFLEPSARPQPPDWTLVDKI